MMYLGLGILGFVLLLLFDICSLCEKGLVKYFFGIGGFSLIIVSSISLARISSDITVLFPLRVVALIFAVLSVLLLIYSVFIEVGKNTYQY